MKYILKLALKNIIFHRKKNIIVCLGYFLCSIFFSVEITTICSYIVDNQTKLENIFGTHDGIYYTDINGVSAIKSSPTIDSSGIIQVYFSLYNNSGSAQRMLVAGSFDEIAKELCRIKVISGRFPKSNNEIMIEKSLMNVMFYGKNIGDEIDIIDGEKQLDLKICGIYEDISAFQWDTNRTNIQFVNAIVVDGFSEYIDYYYVPVKLKGKTQEFENIIFCPNRSGEYDALYAASKNSYDNGFIFLIYILSVFSVVVMISMSFFAKKSEEKAIGLWKIAGLSTKNILLLYCFKLLILAIPMITLGSLTGYGIEVLIGIKNENIYIVLICFAVSLFVMISSFLLFVDLETRKTVIDNISLSIKGKELNYFKFSTKNPILLYSIKNYLVNSREIAVAGISLFIATCIILISSSVTINAMDYLAKSERPYDTLVSFDTRTVTSLNISLDGKLGLSKDEYNILKKRTVSTIGIKSLYVYEITNDIEPADYSNENYILDKEKIGFPSNRIIPGIIMSFDDEVFEKLKKYLVSGDIDRESLVSGKEVVLCKTEENEFSHLVGDRIRLAYGINENPINPSYEEISYHEIEVTVSALVDIPANERMFTECIRGGFVWAESAFDEMHIEKNYSSIYSIVGENDDIYYDLINEFKSYYGNKFYLYDFLQERKNQIMFYDSFKNVSFVIVICLIIFSIINFTITFLSRMVRRKKLFGFLRALGLTKIELVEMIFIEGFFVIAVSTILGVVCGIVFDLIIDVPVKGFGFILLIILSETLFIVGLGIIVANNYFRKTVVECISSRI